MTALCAGVACGNNSSPTPQTTTTTSTSTSTTAVTTSVATTTSVPAATTTIPSSTTSTSTTTSSTTTSTSTAPATSTTTTSIPAPTLTLSPSASPCGLTQVGGTLQGACSFTASANFTASNYKFTIGAVEFTPGSATLASGWSVSCGQLGPANGGLSAINVMAGVTVSALNTGTNQTVTSTTQQILFSKPAGAC